MDCETARPLLEADGDGELDLVRHLEIEGHLRGCAGCAAIAAEMEARRGALREALPRLRAPMRLVERVRADAGLGEKAAAAAIPRRPLLALPWRFGAVAASLVAVLALGYAWGAARTRANALFEEAIAQHVRSLQEHHLTDVASTDQHTVKPWFAGRIDFSPPVVDLAAAGFPLIGGRLDLLAGRTAAALVYGRRQHVVNLFLWPAGSAPIATRDFRSLGFNATSWTQADLDCLAVSEIPESELAGFAATFRAQGR